MRYCCEHRGRKLRHHTTTPPAMTASNLAVRIGQRNAADMAIRFKALKMGATVEIINTMDVFALLDWISDNA
jgi:hypothetical protein